MRIFPPIKTIKENTSLGSGYNISRSDMELRGSGTLFGYKQSGVGGSVGYEMYLRLIQRAFYDAGRLETDFKILPEDVLVELYNHRYIPKKYITIEKCSIKNLISHNSDLLNCPYLVIGIFLKYLPLFCLESIMTHCSYYNQVLSVPTNKNYN